MKHHACAATEMAGLFLITHVPLSEETLLPFGGCNQEQQKVGALRRMN